ncbi:MAG TPA: GNAT family N-acetyltransferase [Solirubrobacterales bacterium]|nr:GNAT family N-acetyltransferase [Solirubrobacterales bacterium]
MASLTVRQYTQLGDLPARAWDALTARPPASLIGSRIWVCAAFEAVHPQAQPFLLAIEDDGRLVALLPLALHSCNGRGALRFAGSPHNDLTDLMVLPGYEREAAELALTTLGAIARSGTTVQLEELDPEGALSSLGARIRSFTWSDAEAAPRIDLTGDWRMAASQRRRRRWAQELNRLRRDHRVEFRRVEGETMLEEFPGFIRLREARLRATGRSLDLVRWEFRKAVISGLAARRGCAFAEMSIDGQVVACDLYLTQRPVAMLWLRGLDPAWHRYSCGHLLLHATAEALAGDGYDLLDLGRGAEPYKFMFGGDRRVLRMACSNGAIASEPG